MGPQYPAAAGDRAGVGRVTPRPEAAPAGSSTLGCSEDELSERVRTWTVAETAAGGEVGPGDPAGRRGAQPERPRPAGIAARCEATDIPGSACFRPIAVGDWARVLRSTHRFLKLWRILAPSYLLFVCLLSAFPSASRSIAGLRPAPGT